MAKRIHTDESLAYQRLLESEERFRNLADTAPMFLAMADETGNAVYFNKPWLEYTGKELNEMLGMGWLSTLHPDDAPQFKHDFTQAFKKRLPINKEYRFKRADGKYRWMLAVGAPRFTPGGNFSGYYGTYTDFHELKEAQLAVKQSEDRFRTLIEKSADAVQLVTATGEIIYSSDSIKNVLGYSPEELADEGIAPYLHPDDKEYFFRHFNDLLAHPNKQIRMQYRVKHKDRSWAWLETVGVNHLNTPNINALVGNFRNITSQKIALEKVHKSEAQFRALADNIPNLAWMARSDGHIYWYNSRWYEYTGTTPEEMEGWGWQKVHDPKVLPAVMKKWQHSIKNGKIFDMVFPIRRADGQFRPFLTRVIPLEDEGGKIYQWVGTNTDISEQLEIKQALARAEKLEEITAQLTKQRKELLELNKAKDEFISIASHQLRTPATGVKQYIGMMLEGYAGKLTKNQREFAERAYESNERELSIINDLLRVAKVDAGEIYLKKSKTDMKKLMHAVLHEQSEKLTAREQKYIFKHDSKSHVISIDEGWIRMVLENLVDNASKYTPQGKTIRVNLSHYRDKMLCIDITDQGVGIEPEDYYKIFDKFVRIDNPLSTLMGGNGLGLYLVKRIVELHNGDIKVVSQIDKGSKFTVLLPL